MGVFARWLPLVASCLVATACSMASIGYEFFATWAHWQIDSYASLDADQKVLVQRRLSELHAWHRQSELPRYVEFLKSTREQALTSKAAAQASQIRKTILTAWEPIAVRTAPAMAELLVTLKPAQIERISSELARANRKLRDEYLPSGRAGWFGRRSADDADPRPAARLQARVERIRKRLEYFMGDLSDEQEKLLRQLASELPATEEIYLAEREARQQRFLTLARKVQAESPPIAEVERWCLDLLNGLWVSPDPVRRQRLAQASEQSDRLTVRMLGTSTPEQQAHFSDQLRKWERDLSRLAAID